MKGEEIIGHKEGCSTDRRKRVYITVKKHLGDIALSWIFLRIKHWSRFCISLLLLLQWITTNLVALNNTHLFSFGSRCQTSNIKVSYCFLSWGFKGESVCLLSILRGGLHSIHHRHFLMSLQPLAPIVTFPTVWLWFLNYPSFINHVNTLDSHGQSIIISVTHIP